MQKAKRNFDLRNYRPALTKSAGLSCAHRDIEAAPRGVQDFRAEIDPGMFFPGAVVRRVA